MKTSVLVVITLLVLGCGLASAQSYTFGFVDPEGQMFCNYEQFTVSGGLAVGIDNLSVCDYPVNSTLLGGQAKAPQIGQGYSGVVDAILADNVFDVEFGIDTGEQLVYFQALKCNQPDKNGQYHGKYGWLAEAAVDGTIFADDYGYLSCTIPEKGDALLRGTTSGKLRGKLRK
jgi:hypothetical protein